MEEKEIDEVVADDLSPNDMIMVSTGIVTVTKRLDDYSDENSDYVRVKCDDDEEYAFVWDERIVLYGY